MSIIAAHHYISICHLRKQENIAIYLPVLQRFDSAFFQTLPNLNVHPGVAVYHTLKIFSIVNAKDLLMPHTKFRVCTLKINTIFCHRKKKSHYFWTGVYNMDFIMCVVWTANSMRTINQSFLMVRNKFWCFVHAFLISVKLCTMGTSLENAHIHIYHIRITFSKQIRYLKRLINSTSNWDLIK